VASVAHVAGPRISPPRTSSALAGAGPQVDESTGGRDRFLDLVRVVAILRVLVIHGAATTGSLWWPLPSWILPGMPLVFFTAGALAAPSVRRHGAAGFHHDRLRRLLVPYWVLLATGLVVLAFGALWWGGDAWTLRPLRMVDSLVPVVQPRLAPALTDLGSHLWFASTFVVLIVLAPALVELHRRRPLAPALLCVVAFAALNAVDRLWTPVTIEVLYVPMYGIFLCAGFGYADGTLLRRSDRSPSGPRPWLRPATAGLVLLVAVTGGWTAFARGTRDLNHDLVGHTCVAAGWLVAVLALQPQLRALGERAAPVLDRITPRTLTLYLWSAPAGVLAWRLAERSTGSADPVAVYVLATVLLTGGALAVFGRIEDRTAGRNRPVPAAAGAAPDGRLLEPAAVPTVVDLR